MDGNFKETRRQDLDKSINQAKGELEALKETQHKRLQALSLATNNAEIREESKGDHWAEVFKWEAEEKRRRVAFGFQDLKGLPLSILERITKQELDELLFEDRQRERLEYRLQPRNERELWRREPADQPLSDKKVKLLEWSIAKMVLKMLHCTANDSMSQDASSIEESPTGLPKVPRKNDFSVELEVIQGRIRSLRNTPNNSREIAQSESPRFPRYITTQHGDRENSRSLNGSIQDAFLSTKGKIRYEILETRKPRMESLIAKICYILLTSSMAPNVRTYNLLLFHLLRLEEYDLVRLVIDSIAEFYLRPNELTIHMILKFYRTVRDREGFLSYVDKMRGKNGGLALAHPHIKITVVNERHYKHSCRSVRYGKDEQLKGHVVNGVNGSNNKIIEKARRNQEVFEQLIKGALEFCGKEKAVKFYRAMIEEGWEPNGTLLGCILKHCWRTLDWPTAELLWQRVMSRGTAMINKLYPVMLCVCLAHDQQHKYTEIRNHGLDRGLISHSEDKLPSLSSAKLCARKETWDPIRRLELRMEKIGWKIYCIAKKLANVKETVLQDSTVEKRIYANMKVLSECLAVGLENTTVMQDVATVPRSDSNTKQRLSQDWCNVYPALRELSTNDQPSPEPAIQKTAQSYPPKSPLLDFQPSSFGKKIKEAYRYPTFAVENPSATNREVIIL